LVHAPPFLLVLSEEEKLALAKKTFKATTCSVLEIEGGRRPWNRQ
jgi:hypothetical protein